MNAQQALPEEGRISLTATAHDEGVEISVRDNGIGMSEQTLSRLFEPFFTTKAREGVGLGPAVVHGIVKAHGGTIEVERAIGQGSCFRMSLPRRPPQPMPPLPLGVGLAGEPSQLRAYDRASPAGCACGVTRRRARSAGRARRSRRG